MIYEPAELPAQLHVDQVDVVVRQVTYPDQPAKEGFVCSWSDFNVSLDEAARASTAVAWNQATGYYEPFAMDQKFSRFSWGADGTALTFVIDLARDVSSDLIVAGIGYAIGRMRGRPSKAIEENNPLDLAGSAPSSALSAVSAVFNEELEALTVRSAKHTSGNMRVKIVGPHGRYTATVSVLESGDLLTHVKRR